MWASKRPAAQYSRSAPLSPPPPPPLAAGQPFERGTGDPLCPRRDHHQQIVGGDVIDPIDSAIIQPKIADNRWLAGVGGYRSSFKQRAVAVRPSYEELRTQFSQVIRRAHGESDALVRLLLEDFGAIDSDSAIMNRNAVVKRDVLQILANNERNLYEDPPRGWKSSHGKVENDRGSQQHINSMPKQPAFSTQNSNPTRMLRSEEMALQHAYESVVQEGAVLPFLYSSHPAFKAENSYYSRSPYEISS